MSSGLTIGLPCMGCGEVFGMAFLSPKPTTVEAVCTKCVTTAMQGKPATTEEEWREVFKKFRK